MAVGLTCLLGLGMELNVSQLLMQPSGSSREYHLDEIVNLTEDIREARILGRVNLLRTNKSVWVSAALDSAIDSECGRCLAPYSHPIHLDIEEEFVPTLNPLTGAKSPPPDNDIKDYCVIDENHILDLTDTVREYTIMALPMKPLCDHQLRRPLSHLWSGPESDSLLLRSASGRSLGAASRTDVGNAGKKLGTKRESPNAATTEEETFQEAKGRALRPLRHQGPLPLPMPAVSARAPPSQGLPHLRLLQRARGNPRSQFRRILSRPSRTEISYPQSSTWSF